MNYDSSMTRTAVNMYYLPVLAEYTPMYMVWVTFIESGIRQL